MILRSITEHVKAQNWFAVGLDFLIVVIGVFIGIQVSNWNEVRQARSEERAMFIRLISEAEQFSKALLEHSRLHLRNVDQTISLIAQLEDPAECADFNNDERKKALLGVGDFPGLRSSLTTAKELASSGRLPLLQSEVMRDAVREIVDQTNYVNEAWRRYIPIKQAAEQVYMAAGFSMTRALDWELDYDDPYQEIIDAFHFRSPEQLCNRPDLVALASNAANSDTFYIATLNQTSVKLESYLQAIKAHADSRWRDRELPKDLDK